MFNVISLILTIFLIQVLIYALTNNLNISNYLANILYHFFVKSTMKHTYISYIIRCNFETTNVKKNLQLLNPLKYLKIPRSAACDPTFKNEMRNTI